MKIRRLVFLFIIFAMEMVRIVCLRQGAYDSLTGFSVWQQYGLVILEKISIHGIGIGAAAGCVYGEIEDSLEQKSPWVGILASITVLFVLTLLTGIQNQSAFMITNLLRMGSYFIFPLVFIYVFQKMKARVDVGGHMIYFWLLIALNMIYISLFQTAGELLVPYLVYQTVLEILLIHWIFASEISSQTVLGASIFAGNLCIYNWYQGKVDFLKNFPHLGKWTFIWNMQEYVMIAVMIICLILMIMHMKNIRQKNRIFLISSCLGIIWEILFKLGIGGLFHIQAQWQQGTGILPILPFILAFISHICLSKRESQGRIRGLIVSKKKSLQ